MNIKIQTVFIFAVSGYESVLRIIQIPKETLVEWKPGTQDRTGLLYTSDAADERSSVRTVMKFLTDLVSHDFTDTLDIATEAKAVFLYIYISKFGYELV